MQRLLIGLVGCFLVVALVASTGLAFIYARVARTNRLRLAASQTQAMTNQTTIMNLNYEILALKKVLSKREIAAFISFFSLVLVSSYK